MKNNYILVLPSWYPSKLDKFNGDFNERLVNAVANYQNQIVVYVSTLKKNKLKETEISQIGNLITYKAYFPNSNYDVINAIRMIRLYMSIFKQIFNQYGLPKLVHNYVFFPSGIISIYLKYRYNLRVVLTEHSSIFNYTNNSNHNVYTHSFYKRIIYKIVLNCFDTVIAVSKSLSVSVSEWTKESVKNYILPNVVDVNFFNNEKLNFLPIEPFTLIHVSDMGLHKNVIGILNVLNKIIINGNSIKLVLVGKEKKETLSFIKDNNLGKHVQLMGEMSYQLVSQAMKTAHAFVMFSRYENMPCVILEALCCGLPIISSNVGGVSTVINKTNGLLVESENEVELHEALLMMIKNYHLYDTQSISKNAISAYNYNHIGKLTNEIYLETLR